MNSELEQLPVFDHLEEICNGVLQSQFSILTATPGSGKTLLVAPFILKNTDLKIAMLQPRRVAAQLSAQSIAQFNNWQVGEEVGLVMKNVHKKSSKTRLTIMTEGVLSRMLSSGAAEKEFDLIILDEFHERSIHTDLACAWAKQQSKVKLLVMSATLDTQPITQFFPGSKVHNVEGRVHPIESHYLKRGINFHDRNEFDQCLLEVCGRALEKHQDGNILVFLPGSGDIQRASEKLESQGLSQKQGVEIHKLYSRAKKEDQKRALADGPQRKIILSTNLAETSLTIPNVKVVIDSGLQKESNYNVKSGVQSLAVRRVALDSATQRAGRAGRLSAGTCYKMWTRADEQRFRKTTPAEIHRIDPIEFILKVMSFDQSMDSFDFLEAPSSSQWELAIKRLEISNCIKQNKLTPLGQWISQFPGDFSSGLLAAISLEQSYAKETLLATVILQEGDPAPFLGRSHDHAIKDDLRLRLEWLKENSQHPYHQTVKKLKKQIENIPITLSSLPSFDNLEEAICFSFTHRLCRFRNEKKKSAIMTTGRGVKIGKNKAPTKSQFFVALEIIDHQLHGQSESEVNFAFEVSKKTIKKVYDKHIQQTTQVETSEKKGPPKAFIYQSLWSMPLEDPRGLPLEKDHMTEHFKTKFTEDPMRTLQDYPESLDFVERVHFCRTHTPEMNWPQFLEDEWTLIVDAAYSETDLLHLKDDDWLKAIQMLFTDSQIEFMSSFAPRSISTQTRKRNSIRYQDPNKPVVSIILQEAFEFKTSPLIGNGSVTLSIELLAPSRRPIEVSQDMAQFWISSYPDIRKQYRGRYPKHSWPENIS